MISCRKSGPPGFPAPAAALVSVVGLAEPGAGPVWAERRLAGTPPVTQVTASTGRVPEGSFHGGSRLPTHPHCASPQVMAGHDVEDPITAAKARPMDSLSMISLGVALSCYV